MIEDQTGSEPGAFVDTYVPEDREDGAVDHRVRNGFPFPTGELTHPRVAGEERFGEFGPKAFLTRRNGITLEEIADVLNRRSDAGAIPVDQRGGAIGGPNDVVIEEIRVDDPLGKILEGGKGLLGD